MNEEIIMYQSMLGEVCSDDCVVRIRMDNVIVGPLHQVILTMLLLSGKTLWSSLM